MSDASRNTCFRSEPHHETTVVVHVAVHDIVRAMFAQDPQEGATVPPRPTRLGADEDVRAEAAHLIGVGTRVGLVNDEIHLHSPPIHRSKDMEEPSLRPAGIEAASYLEHA